MKIVQIPNGIFAENCYLVVDEASRECAIVDPGEEAGLILHKLQDTGARPVAIWITHAHLDLEDSETKERSQLVVGGVFVFIGFKPNTGLVEGHFKHDASGYIETDARMMTSIPGLFAAGDLRSQLTRQITTAVGDATTAAIAVEKYIAARREQAKAAVGAS